ncbi:bifunctional diguanylate cyclase/phosphodiesterase [Cellulomonas sp. KRMCY2]|uniref:putative bifunctional diguanylate cyclase/phosphodiesterase n=1 Tax=Cellulomonas sp. KRMCY2 TaxID=1304865 RepID=UPI0009DEA237|nr:EAL domain-containing protein [Cellulomonas sp. KRMCY2]
MPPSAVPATPRAGRGLSLTRRFALISLTGTAVLGVALVAATSQALDDQALAHDVATAEAVAGWTTSVVPLDAYGTGLLDPDAAGEVTAVIDQVDPRLLGVRLWTADGTLLLDTTGGTATGAPIGFADTARLDAAVLRGVPAPEVLTQVEVLGVGHTAVAGTSVAATSAAGAGAGGATPPGGVSTDPVMDVYVPVTYSGQLVGAAEVMLDHTPTAATQATAVRTLGLVAGGGLLLLWLVLYRTVHTASDRLQRSAMDNARMALLDALTGLPNRRMLLDRLDRAVAAARLDRHGVGILLLDIDRFKDINDSLGHDRGDELLVQVAERLMDTFRGRDLVARLGGDEFAVLLPGLASVADAERLAHRARAVFTAPFRLGEMNVHVATSIGVAALPEHADDASDLMRKADVAMYTAKQHRLGVAVYDLADDDSSPARLVLQAELHRALTRPGELSMHYQPKIDLVTGATVGLEALMRWQHPTRGAVEPSTFIPLAEQSGLIDDLTQFALRTVTRQLSRWASDERLPVAVNLSGHAVASTEIVDTITRLLLEHDVGPEWLEVEITETVLVTDPGRVVPVLQRLVDAGIRVAIDDFGIGSTSISQLRDLPVETLKIDRLFIEDLRTDADARRAASVVKAMVDLAHSFGMQVIAEGVEDGRTAATLLSLDVDQAQGFWYSHAVPAAEAVGQRGPVRT